ncbi:hypothetical protein FLA105534_04149 [Flavobacterium bizetiae]|uniref:DUF885 domain-containing protein n=1 Tax=Flavobacterium bizetiae TaxID=2704140 RepID=A0A6J4GX66_9FLAO|nr:DUF885 domain-containing protein [Flavobacterium bizetiae]CAA9202586.1 hypothetical protein FLA105534_04149 [Flavobacterium bizetiae]CAD5344899.1 hypothetical protein FLA105535_04911 [Flavobacterium bizetiae]CAD5350946.1 hypothetical protein FLA105534_04947 [Flavobacterium bizetiae]
MKKLFVPILAISLLISCNKSTKSNEDKALDAKFDKYKDGFVTSLWKINPGWASGVGYHKYDSILSIPDASEEKIQLEFVNAQLDSLKQYDIENLSDNNKTDFQMIKNQLEATIFSIKELKSSEWNPSEYNVCGSFAEILNGKYDSLEVRLRAFSAKLKNVPAYYEAAKKNIKNPTIEHTELAIAQNLGGSSVFDTDLTPVVQQSKLSDREKKELLDKAKVAKKAIVDYADWLKNTPNKTPRSFRLGADLYAKKFNFDIQSSYTADEIFKVANDHKKDLHDKMFVLADKLWTKYKGNEAKPTNKLELIKQVIDKISLQHTTPEKFQSEIEKQIPELTAYVKAKDLLYIDPSKPLVVRKEPAYMAGVAGASISAPGPYDKNANTYYNVGSLAGWTPENAESYLREYNDYILQILNIHEAVPGHYTQLVYSNQSPSIIKSILGNGAMVEGWAVYAEKMMLESGYKNSDEMWLMYYKWNLRATCNTILDISVHTKNMSKEAAIDLLTKEAFQQQAEADGKWRRVTLSQVQLCSYFTGYTEIYNLREELKKKEGDKFNLKQFHEKFLSFGSAPVKYIKELMISKE